MIAAGGLASRTVFSGVGKSAAEMRFALEAGVRCFNVESAAEVERLNAVASNLGRIAPIAFRVNPDVDPKTHPYISTGLKKNKFGVAIEDAFDLYQRARALPNLRIRGIACHIGSQLLDPEPIAEATGKVIRLADRLAKVEINSNIWTWAAAWASVIATRNRPRLQITWPPCCATSTAVTRRFASNPAVRWWATPACLSRGLNISSTARRRTSPSSTRR